MALYVCRGRGLPEFAAHLPYKFRGRSAARRLRALSLCVRVCHGLPQIYSASTFEVAGRSATESLRRALSLLVRVCVVRSAPNLQHINIQSFGA